MKKLLSVIIITVLVAILMMTVACTERHESTPVDTNLQSDTDTQTIDSTEMESPSMIKTLMSDTSQKYPSNIFTEDEPFEFYYSTDDIEIEWQILDWRGEEFAHGIWDTGEGPLIVSDMPLGYYVIQIKEEGALEWDDSIPFARLKGSSRTRNSDNPYGLDTAQSIFSVSNTLLSDLAYLSGTKMIRDRMRWNTVKFVSDVAYWGKLDETKELLRRRNIDIVNVLYDPPREYKGNLNDLPHDLIALYDFARMAADHFSGNTPAVEFWNEQDIVEFCTDSAWDFAAAQKVAYLGLKAGNPEVNVLIGSTTQHLNVIFNEIVFANDVSSYFDTFNFHIYTSLDQYSKVFQGKVDLLERWKADDKPIWITEFGIAQSMAVGKGTPVIPGKPEHDKQQELLHADFLVKGNIILQSLGSENNFFFILPPHMSPNNRVYSLLRHNLTIKPGYVAHSNLIAQLGEARYLGKTNLDAGMEGYLYEQPNGKRTLVFWGGNTISLKNQPEELELVDMMGINTTVQTDNGNIILESGEHPQYLHGIEAFEAEPTKLNVNSGNTRTSSIDQDIILRVDLNNNYNIDNRIGAKLITPNDTEVILDIFNFSNEEKRVELNDLSKGCEAKGLPGYVTVPPMDKVSYPIDINIINSGWVDLRIGGKTSEGRVSRVYIPVSS